MATLTVSGPGVDVTLRGYGPGAALSRALTEAERAHVETASFYVRDEAGTAVGRVDRENGQTYVYSKSALDREAEDGGSGASLRSRRASSSTRRPNGQTTQNPTKEEPEVATHDQKEKKTQARRSSRRSSTASALKRAPAAQEAPAVEPVAGDDLYKALIAEVKKVVHGVEAKPNTSGTYTRLLVGGKAFAYVFPPRKGGVALKIPKQLLAVARELPEGHGFKKTGWGLTRTIKDPAETTVVAKALAVAAKAVKA